MQSWLKFSLKITWDLIPWKKRHEKHFNSLNMEKSVANGVIIPNYSLYLPERGLHNLTHCPAICSASWRKTICLAPLTLALTAFASGMCVDMTCGVSSRTWRDSAYFRLLTCSWPLPQDRHVSSGGCSFSLYSRTKNYSYTWPTAKRNQVPTNLWRKYKIGKKWAFVAELLRCCGMLLCSYT